MAELNEETVDVSDVSGDTDTPDNSENSELNTSSDNKKFDVWKEYKKLKKEVAILKKSKEVETDEDEEYEEETPKTKKSNELDEVKYEIFLLKNPDASEYDEEIRDTLSEFPNMSLEKALAYAKANYTKSTTKKDFTTKSAPPKKELKDFSKEEILATKDNKKILEWSRLNGLVR